VQVGHAPDVFVPMTMMAVMMPTREKVDQAASHWMNLMGRLKPGVIRERAEASFSPVYKGLLEADAVQRNLPRGFREKYVERKIVLEPGAQGRRLLADEAREPLLLLMGMVGLVLLIACANVANLLLARGLARARDIAVRMAMGASRARLTGQLVTESLLLALAGGAAGIAVAYWSVDGLLRALPTWINPANFRATPDLRVLAFTFALSLATGMAFGLLPALRSTRLNLAPVLKDQATSVSSSAGHSRIRKALIVAQVAFTVMLLTTAGLFATSLARLNSVRLGMDTSSVVGFTVSPHLNGYSTPRAIAFHRGLRESLAALPAVRSAGFAEIPVFNDSDASAGMTIQGYTPAPDEDVGMAVNVVSPGYFTTLGIPLASGRDVAASDTAESPKVCWINETAVRKYFAGRNPLGYKIGFGRGDRVKPEIEIVGVVADSRHSTVREQLKPFEYFPYTQNPRVGVMTFYVKAAQDPVAMMNTIRTTVRQLDPNIPVVDMKTLERQIADSLTDDRLLSSLAAAFALLAALLAAVGIYGVMVYNVGRRTREIGIRVALGAPLGGVRNMVLREVVVLTALGVALGVPAAYALGRFTETMLYGVKPSDPLVTAGAVVAVGLVALLAGWLPARRAMRIDPLVALRYE
jgi:predicted permease